MGIASLILGIVSLVMMFLVLVAKISFGASIESRGDI